MKYIQVEVTRNCGEKCVVCPHRKWDLKGEISFEDLHKLTAFFPEFEIVYLQGWGEPLLHKNFLEMLKIAKKFAKTGFTTNGKKLARVAFEVAEVTDFLLVSFGGVESHNDLRGVSFDRAIEAVKAVAEAKKATGGKVRVGVSYMLTEPSLSECVEFVKLASEANAEYVVFTNLDYVFDEVTDELRVFGRREAEEVEKAVSLAKKLGMEARAYPLRLEEQPVCEANPHLSVAVSCELKIYSCIYLCLPFEKIPRIFNGEKVMIEKPEFGSIFDRKAWKRYGVFVQKFKKRIFAYERALDGLMSVSPFTAIRRLSALDKALADNPPPEVCRSCYKLYGV